MGWWNVEGTSDTIGDLPLDALGEAVSEVVSLYQSAFDRRPTKAEWEALLVAVLGSKEPDLKALDEGAITRVEVQ
jgi:hypothetical protein